MSSEDRLGTTPQGGTFGQSQTGTSTGVRSAEYDDGLTVQDTTHGAEPRMETRMPGASAFGGRTDTLGGQGSTAGTTSAHDRDLGDNRDGLGRDRTDAVTADESGTLIAADKVIGTAVYDASGERLGTIDSIMLNKRSGKVAYAVMSFGGFLGIGERYHPLPWDVLTYDQAKGGYNIQHSADDLRKAPNYSRDEVDSFTGGGNTRPQEVDDYYGVNIPHGSSTAAQPGTMTDAERTQPNYGSSATGIEAADAIGSTTGAGSSGMGSTGMGSNRNF